MCYPPHPGRSHGPSPGRSVHAKIERFNGRIEGVLQSHHFNSGEDLAQTILRYVRPYNGQLPPIG